MSNKVKEQVKVEAPQVEAAEAPPIVAPKPTRRVKIGDRGFFRKGTARLHAADVVEARTVTTAGGTSYQILQVIYYTTGVGGWTDLAENVLVGKEVGQWWHSLEDLEVEAGLVKPEQQ